MRPVKRANIGAILWILCLQYFVAQAVAIRGWTGSYSLTDNYISDLGAVGCGARVGGPGEGMGALCSPLHALMNASFMLQGLLIMCGALLARPLFPKGKLWAIAMALIAIAGLGVLVVGLAPEDVRPNLHYAGAAANLIGCNAGMAFMGGAMLVWRRETRMMGLIAFGAGAVGLLAVGCLTAGLYPGLGVGGMERLSAYPFPIWLAGMGFLLLRRRGLLNADQS
jgi:hypothetical membrane protein